MRHPRPCLCAALFGALLILSDRAEGQVTSAALVKEQITEDIWLFRAPSDIDKWTSSNSLVILSDEGVVVFDNNALPGTAQLVLAEIRKLTDRPVRMMINSHWHMDHWSGNEVYADTFPDLRIVATHRTRELMSMFPSAFFAYSTGASRMRTELEAAVANGRFATGAPATDSALAAYREQLAEREVFEREVAAVRRILPNVVYDDSLEFRFGGRTFRLLSMTGDAVASTVLHLPDDGVIAAGDVLPRQEDGRGGQPWTMNSYAVSEWLESLRRLERIEADVIVPGQGPSLRDRAYLRDTRELYEVLIAGTRRALAEGAVTVDEIRARIDLADLRRRLAGDDPQLVATFDAVAAGLISKISQEARDGIAAPR